ncbi:MAG: outer membrane beta-barrel protein [Verrucomicrobiota bacterium]
MKIPSRFVIVLMACAGLALIANAGPEPIASGYKESKEMAATPLPTCDWSGVYVGLHIGGQFGHSETNDLDDYYFFAHHHFGYGESGLNAGGQVGYNFQFGRFVLGPEFDIGYMNLDGNGAEPHPAIDFTNARGETDSDFYLTFRGRLGYALDWHGCWLLYATGGVIGLNYDTRFVAVEQNMGGGIDTSKHEFNWGPTVGGGIERQLGWHWSIKVEYLYFTLDEQSFSGLEQRMQVTTSPQGVGGDRFRFEGETLGHIVRAGLNFRF